MPEEKEKEKEKDMAKEYEVLKKKFALPELKELDQEFCIGKLEEAPLLLRSILSKMIERLELVFKTLSDVVQPSESNLTTMYEAEMFSDDEKKHIFELMKRMAYLQRELIIKDFEYADESAAAAIYKTFREWKEMKKDVLKMLIKLRDSWKSESKSKVEENYFG